MELRMGLWLLATIAMALAMFFWHKRRVDATEQVGSAEEFSNLVLYFDPFKGEGHIFMGGTLVIVFFSLFMYEFAQIFMSFFF